MTRGQGLSACSPTSVFPALRPCGLPFASGSCGAGGWGEVGGRGCPKECRPPAPFSLRPKDSGLLPLLSQTQESGPPASFIPRIQESTPQTHYSPGTQESQRWETDTEEEKTFRVHPQPIKQSHLVVGARLVTC